jgi:hypothetical protein
MFRLHRVLIAYAVAFPMALILGYLVATPDMTSIAVVLLVLFCLALPLLVQWNHGLLIFFWNSAFIAGFLPGALPLWIVFAGLTFGMGVINLVMGHRKFLRAPELAKPLLMLAVVVVVTAKVRGGLGMRVLGSESFGGKKYFFILAAIIGYFALLSEPISIPKAGRAVKWYFLSGLSYGMTNIVYTLGPAFFILYYFMAPDFLSSQVGSDWGENVIKRFGGLGPSASGLLCFILARWGIRGVLEWHKPWRLLLFIAALAAGLFSGYRSMVGLLGLLLVVQFVVEGLWKTFYLPALAVLGILCLMPLLLFANKMPAVVQRGLAFLPLDIDSDVRTEAANSSQWRYEMWAAVWPEVPRYLLLGKGYAIDPVDLYLTNEATQHGLLTSYESSILAGDYHNGPLSVLMPFGIFGAIAFVWLQVAGIKVLYCNRRYGDPRLKLINDFFLSYFLTQCVFFYSVIGALSTGLPLYLGILGLSVSLNGGVCRKKVLKAVPVPASADVMLQPA